MKNLYLFLTIVFFSCAMSGCARNVVTTTEVTKTGKNWGEIESTQQYRNEKGRMVKEKQRVKEKIKCIDKKGRPLSASTPEECMEKNGTIVDEIKTVETRSN